MTFSIIVPIYNVEKYLEECLKSLEKQTFQDYELILVDDGSEDASGVICDNYAKNHSNVIVIHKKNEGLLLARRTGIKEAKGDYILHCDADDYLDINTLEIVNNYIDKVHPDMVMYGYAVVDDCGNELEEHYHVFNDGELFNDANRNELLRELTTTAWLNNMVTKATKRNLVDTEANYSEYRSIKMGEDLFQVIPLIEKCKTFVFIEKPLYYYRRNPKGMSKTVKPEYLENYLTISERVYQMLTSDKSANDLIKEYINRYLLDVYKYLLRFEKIGMSKKNYSNTYEKVLKHSVYKEALQEKNCWNKANMLLAVLVKPKYYHLSGIISKTLLSNKLVLR